MRQAIIPTDAKNQKIPIKGVLNVSALYDRTGPSIGLSYSKQNFKGNYLIGLNFVGQNFRRTKFFVGQNLRHQ